ncbi:hypothetical protein LCGC14_0386350 [marine sediment metagenome]|uniref:Uncharacterized protein n=1 Tax=marine sediment metagenome TaxID=412755 RepID=A0A0F9VN38_9ZZZZ
MTDWKDTVMKANDLCLKVCQDHRTRTLEGKNCDGLDCEECQLKAQAGISFKAGGQGVVDWVVKKMHLNFGDWWEWEKQIKAWGLVGDGDKEPTDSRD